MATKEQEAAAKAAAEKAPVKDAALPSQEPVRVKAKRPGFYDNGRKRVGDEFTIPAGEKPGSWMEVLDAQADGTK